MHNKHYLGGYSRLCLDCRRYLAVVIFATVPVESFIVGMLEDDRFFKFAGILRDKVQEQIAYVETMPLAVWSVRTGLLSVGSMPSSYRTRRGSVV